MTKREILVHMEDDLPLIWEAIIHVIDKQFPEWEGASIEFDKLPRHVPWHFEEPKDADAFIGHIANPGIKPPYNDTNLYIGAEYTEIDAPEGGYDDVIIVTVKCQGWDKDETKFKNLFKRTFRVEGEEVKDFQIKEESET